jgi:uncharacterized membrane protein
MTLAPLATASQPIQLHVVLPLTAIILTPLQFILQKGTFRHRIAGYVWTFCMMVGAAISFWLPSHFAFNLWGFSTIHLLSILSIVMVPIAINHARNGRIMYRMLFAGG